MPSVNHVHLPHKWNRKGARIRQCRCCRTLYQTEQRHPPLTDEQSTNATNTIRLVIFTQDCLPAVQNAHKDNAVWPENDLAQQKAAHLFQRKACFSAFHHTHSPEPSVCKRSAGQAQSMAWLLLTNTTQSPNISVLIRTTHQMSQTSYRPNLRPARRSTGSPFPLMAKLRVLKAQHARTKHANEAAALHPLFVDACQYNTKPEEILKQGENSAEVGGGVKMHGRQSSRVKLLQMLLL